MPYTLSQAFPGRSTVLEAFDILASPQANAQIAEVKTINFTGSKYDLADVTNMQSGTFREWLPTLADSGELSFTANYIPGDTSQSHLTSFFNNANLIAWTVVLPLGLGNITFSGYVVSIDRDIPIDKEATLNVKIKVTGKITTP